MKNITATAKSKVIAQSATAIPVEIKHVAKIEPIAKVVHELTAAKVKSNAVIEHVKVAAKLAAEQLDDAIDTVGARVSKVLKCYAEALGDSKYVAGLFKTYLQLNAAGTQPLSFVVKDNDGNEEEVHTTAAEAATMPKRYAEKAKAELNDLLGTGRKRPAKKPSAEAPSNAGAIVGLANLSHDAVIMAVKAKLHEEGFVEKLSAMLKKEVGLSLQA